MLLGSISFCPTWKQLDIVHLYISPLKITDKNCTWTLQASHLQKKFSHHKKIAAHFPHLNIEAANK